MVNKKKAKRLLALLLVFSFLAKVSADEKRFSQRIEWTADKNAFEYRVELKNLSEAKSTFYPTEKTSLDLHLKPGKYSYRVFVYDLLGREAAVSPWTKFEIIKATLPKIAIAEPSAPIEADENGKLSLDVDIEGISEESVIELVAEPVSGKVVSGKKSATSETGNASKINFDDVSEGKWRLRVINPSGLTSESDVIDIKKKSVVVKVSEKEQESEKEEPAAEAEPAEDESTEAEPEITVEEPSTETAVEEAYDNKKDKSEKPPRQPYVCKDINIMTLYDTQLCAFNTMASPMDTIFKDEVKTGSLFPDLRISYFPIKNDKKRYGVELTHLYRQTSWELNDAYNLELKSNFVQANYVFQRRIFTDRTYFSLKGGFGLERIQKKSQYDDDAYVEGREAPEDKTYNLPSAQVGVSFFAIPLKYIVFEAGVDYTHTVFALKSHVGFVNPYVALGIRF